METIKVKKPSVPVMRKLHKGETATLTKGDDFEILVSASMAKKIKKAHDKGKGIRVKLEKDAISEMEGKGAWDWLKKTARSVAAPIAKISKEATQAITGSAPLGKVVESGARFLLGKDEFKTAAGGAGGVVGSEIGSAIAIGLEQPELVPIAGAVGGLLGSMAGKEGAKALEKATKKKKKPPSKAKALDAVKKAAEKEEKKKEQERKKKEKEDEKQRKKQEKEADKQRKKQEAEMRKQAMKPYKGRDTSGRLKTFTTLTGATADPVPVESQFQGTGKGSVEMKEKMAKLRAMRKKKMSGKGIIAEGEGIIAEGEGISMEIMEGKGKAYTKDEWTMKLCEGENSLLEQKKKKIDEREAKKAPAKKAPAKKAPAKENDKMVVIALFSNAYYERWAITDKAEVLDLGRIKAQVRRYRVISDPNQFNGSIKDAFDWLFKLYKGDFLSNNYSYNLLDYDKADADDMKEYGLSLKVPSPSILKLFYQDWYKTTENAEKTIKLWYDEFVKNFTEINMSGEGKQTGKDKEDEKLAMKVSDMEKKVAVIEKEHEKMTGKGIHELKRMGEDPSTWSPVIEEPPKLGADPATWSPVVSAPRPDIDKGHSVPVGGRFSGVSGSKLLGRRHQGFSSQPHSINHMWKTTLGMPR